MVEVTNTGEGRALAVEGNGINVISDAERTGRPADLFWPWFGANVSVLGLSYGAFTLGFGISFWQAVVAGVVGILFSFLLCGVVALAGKRGSAPTMVLSRAAFGVRGNKLPTAISWLLTVGWETALTILATLATATVFERLGWGGGTATKIVALLVVAALVVGAGVLGFTVIMRLQTVITVVTGVLTIVFVALAAPQVDWGTVSAVRLSHRSCSSSSGCCSPGRRPSCPTPSPRTRSGRSPPHCRPGSSCRSRWSRCWGWSAGLVLDIYSSGLALLTLGLRIPRWSAALVDGVIMVLGTVYVVFFADDFLVPFQGFLYTLGVPVAAWAGVMLADVALRRQDYAEPELYDPTGRYGDVRWTAVALVAVATVLGWGLVTNSNAEILTWQGFLLGPLGLGGRDGAWAYANLGVLVALAVGFVGTLLLERSRIRAQEA